MGSGGGGGGGYMLEISADMRLTDGEKQQPPGGT